jgi:hypothetical protein
MFHIHFLLKRVGLGLGLLPSALGSLRVALVGTLLLIIAQTATAQTLTTPTALRAVPMAASPVPNCLRMLRNLYGTTSVGGVYGQSTVFSLTP